MSSVSKNALQLDTATRKRVQAIIGTLATDEPSKFLQWADGSWRTYFAGFDLTGFAMALVKALAPDPRSCLPDCMMPDGADPCAGYHALQAEIEQLHAKLTCCCGDAIDHSSMAAGHSPVSMYDHALDGAHRRIAELEDALGRISRGGTAVLLDAALAEDPINPDVLQQIVTDADAALATL